MCSSVKFEDWLFGGVSERDTKIRRQFQNTASDVGSVAVSNWEQTQVKFKDGFLLSMKEQMASNRNIGGCCSGENRGTEIIASMKRNRFAKDSTIGTNPENTKCF